MEALQDTELETHEVWDEMGMDVDRGVFFKSVILDRPVSLKNHSRGQINKASKID